jgi:protein phosphatase 1L
MFQVGKSTCGMWDEVITTDIPRVQGTLAVSRALGDLPLKPFVAAQPHIAEGLLGKENDLALLASDALWHGLDLHEALQMARAAEDPQKAADQILFRAYAQGTPDDITIMVLDLRDLTRHLTREKMEITAVEG